jgi:hypothetical protein
MSNTFSVQNTIISGSNIINSAKLSIFNANLLNGTVIGSLTGANSGDQLTWDNTNYEWVPLTSNI